MRVKRTEQGMLPQRSMDKAEEGQRKNEGLGVYKAFEQKATESLAAQCRIRHRGQGCIPLAVRW